MQSTYRELQRAYSNRNCWISLAVLTGLLTITGPFGTYGSMDVAHRFLYWLTICFLSCSVGFVIFSQTHLRLSRANLRGWTLRLSGAVLSGAAIGTFVWGVSLIVFQLDVSGVREFLEFNAESIFITFVITIGLWLCGVREVQTAPSQTNFFDRLPGALGRRLLVLEAQDHYVHARTELGSTLILMRLGDAEKELADFPGFRVHRSWWVADDAIAKINRSNGRTELVLRDGSVVPVSRSYTKTLRDREL